MNTPQAYLASLTEEQFDDFMREHFGRVEALSEATDPGESLQVHATHALALEELARRNSEAGFDPLTDEELLAELAA